MYKIRFILAISSLLFFCCCSDIESKKTEPRLQLKDTTITQPEIRTNPYAPVDVSPMDMSYYPVDYPKLKMTNNTTEPLIARVIYSRPHLQGRDLFHGLLSYGQPWRLGANEATELDLFKAVSIQGKKVNEGRYILYCIPYEDKWTIVLNKNIDTWGLKPDSTKDAYRFDIPVKQTENRVEFFTMVFEKAAKGANLIMAWDDVEARLLLQF
ncbi:MAG: DUF2911 domain-containing protein [Bacteroidetes bacterium]|nr:DUF2911 domain-containing protein [Bacteroidota bacterium]MBS1607522.1 DUF2911 domain-containing protein [Bacteroidota bacterium]